LPVDFTHRFDKRAALYSKYRPGYPKEIIAILKSEIGFTHDSSVADVGSGTGLLSRLFLENGNQVYGIEPNDEMRAYAEETLSSFPGFISVKGRAENTTLKEASVDLITVGQALHWFDRDPAIREFERILSENGHLCVLYNDRNINDPFMKAYEDVVQEHARDRAEVLDVWRSEPWKEDNLSTFFQERKYGRFTLPNEQFLDLEGLLGRMMSASYMPNVDETDKFKALSLDVSRLFNDWEKGGTVRLLYETIISVGRLRRESV
jgi:ubiquinone/menaquinone biosynthesis C-methylase UbiE